MSADLNSEFKSKVVACIPAYNEEKNIAGVLVRAMRHVDEVVVCNDGSIDLTGDIAKSLGAVVLRHEQNMGYGAALKSSFKEALRLGANIIVTLDGDGQHDPGEIPTLVRRLEAGDVDLVIGSRFVEGAGSGAPSWRENGIKFISGMVSNDRLRVTDAQSGFRAYRRKVLESFSLTEDGMGISTEILLKSQDMKLRVAEVPINVSYNEGSSTHNPMVHGVSVVLSTLKHISIKRPLLFYGLPGFLATCVAGIFWVVTIRAYTTRHMISTNVTLIALSATLVGLMLMTIAIILWVLISVVREKI